MNYNKKNIKLDKSQAIASIGQIELMNLFSQTFAKYKLNISQILLTLENPESSLAKALLLSSIEDISAIQPPDAGLVALPNKPFNTLAETNKINSIKPVNFPA